MKTDLQVSFRNMDRSDAVEAAVREAAGKLERFHDRITGCHVLIEAPHRRHQQGKLYHVRVDVLVPGGEVVVNRDPPEHHAHEDVYVAIRDAFDAARRRLEDYVRRHFTEVKAHEPMATARVSELFPQEDYGFLETPDGRRLYFHRHSVLGAGFDRLDIGSEVHFAEEMGDKGPQASTVRPL